MENSGDSARDSGDLRGELRNSGDSDHSFWRTQGRTQGAPPLGGATRNSKVVECRRNPVIQIVAETGSCAVE